MSTSDAPLSEEERAELEALRAERAEREARERARAERAELEALKADRKRRERESERDAMTREIRERNARIMTPDEDLHMPLGQKIVLASLAVIVLVVILMSVFA